MAVHTRLKKMGRSPWLVELERRLHHGDVIYNGVTVAASLLILLVVVAIGGQLWQNSALPRAQFGLGFLTGLDWDPVSQVFGALPFLFGTLETALLAVLIAVPIGLGIAIFLSELAPSSVSQPLGFLIELLAAVPSVIYGLWGLYVFIPTLIKPTADLLHGALGFLPLFEGPVFGTSRLAASLVLSIMILPTISAVSRDVFRAIPAAQREASMALGSTRWEMISQVLVPYGMSGILGAVILGLGRALGETIAVTMVIGNNLDLSASLLHPGYTMASIIANEFAEATYDLYVQSLIEIALVLFVITLLLNLIARFLVWRVSRRTIGEVRV
ncbi:MAG: phosphate ABC transporter permease subunit PstC [Anaerolineae bacterium]